MLLVASAARGQRALTAGALACPGCSGGLRPWGWTKPRRARARDGRIGLTQLRRAGALCIEAHMNLKTIQTRLGHSSIRVTGDRYAHLLQAVEERDVASLNDLAKPMRRATETHVIPS
jgi:integrase